MTRKKLVPLKRGRKPLDPTEKLERKRKRDREYKRKKRQKEKEKAVAVLLATQAASKPTDGHLLTYEGDVILSDNNSVPPDDLIDNQQRIQQSSFESNPFFLQQQQLMASQLYQDQVKIQTDILPLVASPLPTTTTTTTTTTSSTGNALDLLPSPDMSQSNSAKKPKKPKKNKDNESADSSKKSKKKKKASEPDLAQEMFRFEPISTSALQGLLVTWGETTNQSSLVSQFLSVYQPINTTTPEKKSLEEEMAQQQHHHQLEIPDAEHPGMLAHRDSMPQSIPYPHVIVEGELNQ